MADNRENLNVAIRVLRHVDEARVCAELMAHSEPWITLRRSYEDSMEILCDPEREVYVALVGDEFVGFTILHMKGAFVGYIQSVAVWPEWRNRGIGSRLLAFAEERIFRETPNAFVCVSAFNPDAQRLYQNLGYGVVGELKDWIVPGHSEILMRKTIAPLKEFQACG